MTYSQLVYRVAAVVVVIGTGYLLFVDRLCLPSKAIECRPVQGMTAVALCLAAAAFAAMLLIASTQPRRGARTKQLIVAAAVLIVSYLAAFFLDLTASPQ